MSKIDQLSVITDEISQDFDHALDVATEYGVKTVDIRKVWNKNIALFTDKELNNLQEALDKRGMKVAVITGPFGKCLMPGAKFVKDKNSFMRNPEYNLSFFNRLVEISDYFKTNMIRIFPFVRFGIKPETKRWKMMKDLIIPYIQKAEELNKILLVENDLGMNVGTIQQTKRFFKEIKSPAVKLVLDPGNYYMERDLTTPEAYQSFYDNNIVGHIHVKDPKHKIPKFGATFGVVGEGKIDYKPLFKQAIDNGYQGYFCLETHALRNKEEISRKSLENMSKWLEEL
ncbi:MAG: sugar phosphate isomerase/epimerase family protein [Promethearchaeota archaeon]